MGDTAGCYTIDRSAASRRVSPRWPPRYSPGPIEGRVLMATDSDDLKFELSDRVATLTLNRPEKLNALSESMIMAAIEHLRRCAEDPDVGAVLVTGAGRAFCAGGDVSAMGSAAREALTFEQRVDRQRVGQELSRLLAEIPKVTIAAVNGAAVGAGLGIALSCDLVFASDRARFGTAFAKVG